jgi:predicted TPR repeat methyltransferase
MAKKVADGDTANQCPTASADMPPSTSGLVEALGQAIALLRDDRLDEAEAAFIGILERWPGQPDALHFQGVLRHSQGRLDEAVELISAALRQIPEHADAWNNLGNVLLVAGRVDDAVQAYERGIAIAAGQPETAAALSNLSIVHRRQGRAAEAESACRRALDVAPDFADAWYNLSLVLMERGEVHEGLLANSRAIALWPQRAQPRDQVIRALLLLGERERAAGLYREWLAEEPDNPVIHHQLAACLGNAVPVRASDAYVQQVFDSFADSFDAKLESLHYRAPELIAQALAEAAGEPRGALDIVDAGCGTGLCGVLVRPWARHLAGCDLSVGMLRRAVPRQVYDVLHQAELVYYLETQPGHFDAVVCADTLCYFGALEAAVAAARRALRPGGGLVFTVEALQEDDAQGHRLQVNGRYAHTGGYVRDAISQGGLELLTLQAGTLRLEAGRPVPGWIVSARRP